MIAKPNYSKDTIKIRVRFSGDKNGKRLKMSKRKKKLRTQL